MFKVFKHNKDATVPTRHHEDDIGWDLYSTEQVFIPIEKHAKVATDISVEIPSGWWGQIASRSSVGDNGLTVLAGIVDANYSAPLKVILHNLSNKSMIWYGEWGYMVKKGDKIAQLIFHKKENVSLYEVATMWDSVGRGSKGFGSSGV